MRIGQAILLLLSPLLCFSGSRLSYDESLLDFSSSTEAELFGRLDELSKQDWVRLAFIANLEALNQSEIESVMGHLVSITDKFKTRKYTRLSRTKMAEKIFWDLNAKYFKDFNPNATISDLVSRQSGSTESILMLVAFVYDGLDIAYSLSSNTEGVYLTLFPGEDQLSIPVDFFPKTKSVEMSRLESSFERFYRQGNISSPYTMDSIMTNRVPKKGSFWRKMVHSCYFSKGAAPGQANLDDAFQFFLKAYTVLPTKETKFWLHNVCTLSLMTQYAEINFENLDKRWYFALNNFNSELTDFFCHAYDIKANKEFQEKSQLTESSKLWQQFHEEIADSLVLSELDFSYFSHLSLYRVFSTHSRSFLQSYLKAKALKPDHIRLKGLAYAGMANYIDQLSGFDIIDTIMAIKSVVPEIENHPKYNECVLWACLLKGQLLIRQEDLAQLQKLQQSILEIDCRGITRFNQSLNAFFCEHSAIFVRRDNLAMGRKILLLGKVYMSECDLDIERIEYSYDLIKDVKSLR